MEPVPVSTPIQDPELVEKVLATPESSWFDCKRIIGKVDKLLETVIAFTNTNGGTIALGLEDPDSWWHRCCFSGEGKSKRMEERSMPVSP